MITLKLEHEPRAEAVTIEAGVLSIKLQDGRTIAVPLEWYPRLAYATAAELDKLELFQEGISLYWPALDEDIRVASLIAGSKSQEGQSSLRRWQQEIDRRRKSVASIDAVNLEPWGRALPL